MFNLLFQVTNSILKSVVDSCQTKTRTICNEILQTFNFDISKATFLQMDIPLYSALIMYTYITNTMPNVPASHSSQALLWKQHIRPTGNTNMFTAQSSINVSK